MELYNEDDDYEDFWSLHPTIRNIDIDKLDNLPYHERLWEKYGFLWESKRYRRRRSLQYKAIGNIIKGSVGKSLSDIQTRIKPLIKSTGYSFTHVLYYHVETEHDRLFGKSNSKYGDYYYIKDNILCYQLKIKSWKTKQHNFTYKESYEYVLKQKKERKLYHKTEKQRGLQELKFINNPILFSYYNSLKSDVLNINGYYTDYLKRKEDLINQKPIIKDKWYKYMMISSLKKWNEKKDELPLIQEKINQLESGDLTPYYNSPNYLHSIGKECPHFENTQLS